MSESKTSLDPIRPPPAMPDEDAKPTTAGQPVFTLYLPLGAKQ